MNKKLLKLLFTAAAICLSFLLNPNISYAEETAKKDDVLVLQLKETYYHIDNMDTSIYKKKIKIVLSKQAHAFRMFNEIDAETEGLTGVEGMAKEFYHGLINKKVGQGFYTGFATGEGERKVKVTIIKILKNYIPKSCHLIASLPDVSFSGNKVTIKKCEIYKKNYGDVSVLYYTRKKAKTYKIPKNCIYTIGDEGNDSSDEMKKLFLQVFKENQYESWGPKIRLTIINKKLTKLSLLS